MTDPKEGVEVGCEDVGNGDVEMIPYLKVCLQRAADEVGMKSAPKYPCHRKTAPRENVQNPKFN